MNHPFGDRQTLLDMKIGKTVNIKNIDTCLLTQGINKGNK